MSTETFLDGRVTMLLGDVRAMLKTLPDDHFDCVVTSPPYWGLRDYGVAGQIGLEPTLGEHLAVMVDVFNEVRRVMKPSATLWLNYGDCFATTPNGRSTKAAGNDDRTFRDKPFSTIGAIQARSNGGEGQHHDRRGALYEPNHESGDRRGTSGNKGSNGQASHSGRVVAGGYLKSGDLCMIPNRLAIALQDAGWWVKSEIIWGKKNPMPDSSGAVRPSTAHEKIWLLSKSDLSPYYRARDTGEICDDPDLSEMVPMITTGELGARWIRMPFYYDAATMKMGRASDEDANTFRGGSYVGGQPGKRTVTGNKRIKMPDGWNTGPGGHGTRHPNGREAGKTIDKQRGHSRRHDGFNDRWDQMTKEEQCSNGRFLRNYEPAPLTVWPMATQSFSEAHFATFPPELAERCILAGCPVGGRALDPFGGAGTTALVAATLGRTATLIELNPEYAVMARARIEAAFMGKEEGQRHMIKKLGKLATDAGPLFANPEVAE
jgi:DNA modification methylase